ncbi:MAG: hypothetical protein ABL308_02580 [Oceanicaulis sp.]
MDMTIATEIELFAAGLVLGLALALAAYLLRRWVWQLFAGALRTFAWPFRPLLRLVGRGERGGPAAGAAASAAVSGHKTLTDAALGDDFAHEESFLQRQGVFFKWLMVRVGFMRMPEELNRETAERYSKLAQGFLGGRVPIEADPRALFEDVEGAVIARQFHESDSGVLYLLNESRKLMNANVRKLAVWFSLILGAVLLVNILANDTGLIQSLGLFAGLSDDALVSSAQLTSLVVGAGSCLLAAMAMWALYYAEYSPYQRNTAREMANFLTRYLARVNDHYRTAVGKAKSLTVGQERDSKHLAEEAQLWMLNISWIALRVFFIETYVRNTAFQIRRNSHYYLVFVPSGFLVALAVLLLALGVFTARAPFETILALGWVFAVLFVLVVALYAFFLINAMKALEEIDQGEWISFHTLRLDAVMSEIVGKYAEDVGYWKNRVGGGL